MDLESGQLIELSGAILAAIVIFVAANAASMRASIGLLLFMIPFQVVDTRFGSANVVMTYVLFGALMLRGRLNYAPMLWVIMFVVLTHLITISQLHQSMYVMHGTKLLGLISGLLMCLLCYNLGREEKDFRYIVDILLWSNVLSIFYCLIQFAVGPGAELRLFGIEQLSMHGNRGGSDARLVGPFGTPGITAAYFMSMTLILVFSAAIANGLRKKFIAVVCMLNLIMMLATANRGSFIVLLLGLAMYMFLFREKLGAKRIIQSVVALFVIMTGAATFVASQTEFGRMFDRLSTTTELEGGLPATRAVVWPIAWENITQKPFFGHGPRLLQQKEIRHEYVGPEQLVSPYPHNLYLYLLVTVGMFGLAGILMFFAAIFRRINRAIGVSRRMDELTRGWLLVGLVTVATILIDELKIEFLRNGTLDYTHFIFALCGVFAGLADRAYSEVVENSEVEAGLALSTS